MQARLRYLPVALVALSGIAKAGAPAASLQEQLARCAVVEESPARLTCYDALAGRKPAAASQPRVAVPQVRVAAPPVADSAVAPSVAPGPQTFGMEDTLARRSAPAGLPEIHAHIAQVNSDRLRRYQVVLDNGQVWSVIDGELQAGPGVAVTIRRAALGSFLMTTASKRSYRVHRIE